MAPPKLQDYLFQLYTSADSYDFAEGKTLEVSGDINQDGHIDQMTYHYENTGFRIDIRFGTTVGCGAPGFYATQTQTVPYEKDRLIYNSLLKNAAPFRAVAGNFHSQQSSEIVVDWNKVLDRYPSLERFLSEFRNEESWKFAKVFALQIRSPSFCKMFDDAMRAGVTIVPQPNPGQGSFFIQSEYTICLDLTDPMLAIASLLHELAHYDDKHIALPADRKLVLNHIVSTEVISDQFATKVLSEIGLAPFENMEFHTSFNLLREGKTADVYELKKYQLSSLHVTYIEQAYLTSLTDAAKAQGEHDKMQSDYYSLMNIYDAVQTLFYLAGKHQKSVQDIFNADRLTEAFQDLPEAAEIFAKYRQQFEAINLIQLSNHDPATVKTFNALLQKIKDECVRRLVTAHAQKFGFTDLL